jgi:hypothetical protein
MYLTQGLIANDTDMLSRVAQAAAQEGVAAAGIDPDIWTWEWRRVWAAAPGWSEAWESALAAHPPETEPDYRPGADPAVITDPQILSQVQSMTPFTRIGPTA